MRHEDFSSFKQKTLDSFVISKSRRIDSVTVTASSSSISSVGSGEHGQIPLQISNTLQSSVIPVSVESDHPTTPPPPILFPENDIGIHIGTIHAIDDRINYELLERPRKLPIGCQMPYSVHLKRGKDEKRYLNDSHLQSFHWLVYSAAQKGLFCKYCPLFVTGASGGSNRQVPLQKLVTKPVTKFAKLLGKDAYRTVHDTSQYHHVAKMQPTSAKQPKSS